MKRTGWKNAAALFTEKNSKSQDWQRIDYSEYHLNARDILREGSIGAIISLVIAYTFYKSLLILIILTPVSFILFPIFRRKHLKNKRIWDLTIQFKEAIWIINGFLSAGISVENAFVMAVPELSSLYGRNSMIVREFQAINKGVKLNKPVEKLLMDFADRSGVGDIRNFAEVFTIAKRSGGSLKDVIERTGSIIREKLAVSEEIKNMTASKRYEQTIMNILPFGIILYINLTTKGFLDVMYGNITGVIIMSICLAMIAASYVLSQKILDIKV